MSRWQLPTAEGGELKGGGREQAAGELSKQAQVAESQQTALTVLIPLPGRCQVRVLPPVPTEGLKPDDVPALADRVRHSMLTVFREISTDGRGGGDYLKKPGGVGEARL